ncbi:hypothetical protein [Stenotrophomonas muris]|uniref:hypothetical protein n=1 Tax=Stenotrophomonas muris TaxID=2963283 RepID=UPI002E7977C6|nr:hypothetical protein [Stenotrophomonas muris]
MSVFPQTGVSEMGERQDSGSFWIIVRVLILIGVAAYFFIYSGLGSKVAAKCELSPLGKGQCQFTNTGWTAGTACAKVGLENNQTNAFARSRICSGIVWPNNTIRKEVSVVIPPGHCGTAIGRWKSTCTLLIRSAETEGADAAVGAGGAVRGAEPVQSGFNPLNAKGQITIGRCHMGYCSWAKWLEVDARSSSSDDLELQVSLLGGNSEHAEDYPRSAEGIAIEWAPEPHTVQVICSYRSPMVDGEPLGLVSGSISGFEESNAELYFIACHSHNGGYPSGIEKFRYSTRG